MAEELEFTAAVQQPADYNDENIRTLTGIEHILSLIHI